MKFEITFIANGRGKAKCKPDPRFPDGMTFDMAGNKKGCVASIPYPAPECGLWLVKCNECPSLSAITAAGRVDDVKTAIVVCQKENK